MVKPRVLRPRPPPTIIHFWKDLLRVVTTTDLEHPQIELQRYSRKHEYWQLVIHFRSLEDFDSFADAMAEAGDLLEKIKLPLGADAPPSNTAPSADDAGVEIDALTNQH
jgi:hypothetical protein